AILAILATSSSSSDAGRSRRQTPWRTRRELMTTRKSPQPGRPRLSRDEDRPAESRNNSDPNHAREASGANQIYGLIPVLEALRAGKHRLEQITIAEGARHERLRELLDLA